MTHLGCQQQGFERSTQQMERSATFGGAVHEEMTRRKLAETGECRPRPVDPRGEFLAMVIHELRGPLNGIQMAIDVLRSAGRCEPNPDWLLAGLEKATRRMTRLTNDLTDLCRMTHPTFHVHAVPLDLAAFAYSSIERWRLDFEQKCLWLALHPRPKPAWILADPERLDLVLGNLLENAAKYTSPGGEVIVSVGIENGEVALRIRDTGIGIEPESLSRVFEPFAREEFSLNQSVQGSGIGLMVVRTLVELHGGSVEASSAGRGKGSTFVVRLPMIDGGITGAAVSRAMPAVPADTCRL